MSNTGKIIAVNVSEQKGTIKYSVAEIVINKKGIISDAHAGSWHRQISLLGQDSIDRFSKQAQRQIQSGEFAENITLTGIDLSEVAILDRFKIGEVELELTQIGKVCHGDKCAIYREVGSCVMPKEGVFCRVITGGKIKPNDVIKYYSRPLKIKLITLSDRAFVGEYEDKSGPCAKRILEDFFRDKRWHYQIEHIILPDDAAKLRANLKYADVIFTIGGTGVGPRDITPEVITKFCDKTIPGIMENIRIKYGVKKPNALLSRSIAGIKDKTQIYAIPGSVKAAQEYIPEILTTLEHVLLMLHGLGH